ncbi:hypothetical protein MNBD_BACTEROID07-2042, partial [hydrothermal vent metagenome]
AIVMAKHTMADGHIVNKPEVLDGCIGCGVCVMVCPTAEASIVVIPHKS